MDDDTLYQLHQRALAELEPSRERFNWHCDFEFKASDLGRLTMPDVQGEASEWRADKPAPDMYFTHALYYRDGIEHIIDELRKKPTSNRALYSLLAQKDISQSDDRPIPSFLTFQCSIEQGTILYCTATFRALEVGKFLRINLEEIRQNLVDICAALSAIETIRLHLFAFHAYVRPSASALRRPAIEVVSDAKLLILMQDGKLAELDHLLGGLQGSATVASPTKLQSLLDILDMPDAKLHTDITSRRGLLGPQLKRAIAACDALAASRKGASRGTNTATMIAAFSTAVEDIRGTLLN